MSYVSIEGFFIFKIEGFGLWVPFISNFMIFLIDVFFLMEIFV